jgi:diguanylate cyclase (GGDEF)-like protein/PAS domain S-box-containing protein
MNESLAARPLFDRNVTTLALGLLILVAIVSHRATTNYFESHITENLETRAHEVADGLINGMNMLMETGQISEPANRLLMLQKMAATKGIRELRIVRATQVQNQFGPGLPSEQAVDQLDREAIADRKPVYAVTQLADGSREFRAVIPYIVSTNFRGTNCLRCHNVQEGSVNGAASITFSMAEEDAQVASIKHWTVAGYVGLALMAVVLLVWRRADRIDGVLRDREAQFRDVIETSPTGFWVVDMEGRFLEVNDAYVAQSGYSRDELLRMRIPDIEAAEHPEETAAHIRKILNEGFDRFETVHRAKDGRLWPAEIVTSCSSAGTGRLFVFITDITERKRQEEAMELASLVYRHSSEAMVVSDAQNRIIAVNPAFTAITGYAEDEIRGRDPAVLRSSRHDVESRLEIMEALHTSGQWSGEVWDRRKNGDEYPKRLTINVIRDAAGRLDRYVGLFSDISGQKESEELIWRQANFDSLTQLPNRHMFRDRLAQEMLKAERAARPLALLLVDLDQFKEVNDTLGHPVGDQLLQEAARRISGCVRDSDTVARLGGDEFAVVLSLVPDSERVAAIAQSMITRLSQPFNLSAEVVHVSASIGVTFFPTDADNIDQMLKNADQAMYVAKSEGRNRISFFTRSLEEAAQNRLRLIADLREALTANQFQVVYQPIIEIASGRIGKAEALLRWEHPQRGTVSPTSFIPLAEDTGLIHVIGDWVFKHALWHAEHWSSLVGGTGFQVSINKSPVQFRADDDEERAGWTDYLAANRIAGQHVVVEITEGLLLKANPKVGRRLQEFREAGVQIAIDDFGTGYSSLAYLKRFPIDYLKVDQAFVQALETDANDRALVEAIIVMAHKLGLKVIAEGVETAGQRDVLAHMGCDFGQGYFFARPMSADFLESLLLRQIAETPADQVNCC